MRITFAVALCGLVLVACRGPETVKEPVRTDADGPADVVYLRECAWCHGARGQGTENGPPIAELGAAGTHFVLSTGRMPIHEPDQPMRRGRPAFDDATIAAIADYVAGFGDGPAIPVVDPDAGEMGLGVELYRDDCAACHSSSGVGGALTSGAEAPSLHLATDTEIAEAMIVGPGTMPPFGAYDDHQLNSVVAYVAYLRDADDRGGADLGRVGPVNEGFIAWVVGLGVLVVVVRAIGTRSSR